MLGARFHAGLLESGHLWWGGVEGRAHRTTAKMLTDTALRNLQPRAKPYKIADRDGLYVLVSPAGTISFRYDYRINVSGLPSHLAYPG